METAFYVYVPKLATISGIVASKGSLIVADALVIAVTWWKLFRETSPRKAFLMRRHVKLADVFLRDGEHLIAFRNLKTI